jgi:cytochrome c-550 PedF
MEKTSMCSSMNRFLYNAGLVLALTIPLGAFPHGDVTPQAVDTHTLPQLGEKLVVENPYRTNANVEAVRIGKSGYNQNCARCHGLEAISGGIAPDLRRLPMDKETDEYFVNSVRRGKVRNGAVYMPPFEGTLSQEAMWAIKAYLETRHTDE